ncbi:MAG TPA: glycosyltransferase family 2 protein, partial [Thermoanaerobaculia bacterium]
MYNEELNIEHAVASALESLEKYAGEYEIVIVNDASTDTSPRIADRLASANPHIRVLHHEKNRKLGGTIRTGFAAAKMELVFYMDADIP